MLSNAQYDSIYINVRFCVLYHSMVFIVGVSSFHSSQAQYNIRVLPFLNKKFIQLKHAFNERLSKFIRISKQVGSYISALNTYTYTT